LQMSKVPLFFLVPPIKGHNLYSPPPPLISTTSLLAKVGEFFRITLAVNVLFSGFFSRFSLLYSLSPIGNTAGFHSLSLAQASVISPFHGDFPNPVPPLFLLLCPQPTPPPLFSLWELMRLDIRHCPIFFLFSCPADVFLIFLSLMAFADSRSLMEFPFP